MKWLLGLVMAAKMMKSALAEESAAARIDELDTIAIQQAIVGKSFSGVYGDNSTWSETYLVDGDLRYSDPEITSSGAWRVLNDRLCTLYQADIEGGCFLVIKRSDNCLDFYAVRSGDGVPLAKQDAIAAGEDWIARGWRSDIATTCENGPVT
jgi:hypothetical protein